MLSPNEITGRKFEKTARGYRMEEVDAFLADVGAAYSGLYEANLDLEQKMEVLADKLEEYRSSEDSLRTVLLGAQKLGDNIVREARAKAEIQLQEAHTKSASIVAAAEENAKSMLVDAKAQMEKDSQDLLALKREVADFRSSLLATYRQHLELISSLPGGEEDPEEQVENAAVELPEESAAEDLSVNLTDEAPEEPEGARITMAEPSIEESRLPTPDAVGEPPAQNDEEISQVSKEYTFGSLKFSFTDELDLKQ